MLSVQNQSCERRHRGTVKVRGHPRETQAT